MPDQDAQLLARIQNTLDVSGAFDNCFFHTYALHLLANDLPLPQDLFTFKSILGQGSPASKLQVVFPDQASLSLFADYAKKNASLDAPISPEFIVEKTLILGFLLREWFATQTKQLDNINVSEQFNFFKAIMHGNFGTEAGERTVATLYSESVLYGSNTAFLKYFTIRPKAPPLTNDESRYEKYFTDTANADKAIEAYWKAEGLQKYCEKFATPGTKIAYTDIEHIIKKIQQPLITYNSFKNQQSGVITVGINSDIPGKANQPKMEVLINAAEGHYRLLKTAKTTPLLDSYHKGMEQYKKDRAEVMRGATVVERQIAAAATPSLFVTAICKPDDQGKNPFDKDPFDLLLDKVVDLKKYVSGPPHVIEQQLMAEAEKLRNKELEQAKRAAEEQLRVKKAEETRKATEAQKKADDEARRKAAEDQSKAEADAAQRRAAEAQSKAEAEATQRKAAEARSKAIADAAQQRKADEELRNAEDELLGPKDQNPHEEDLAFKRELARENFYKQLEHLTTIITDFEQRRSQTHKSNDRENLQNAQKAAQILYDGLDSLATDYFKLKNPRPEEDYAPFKTACDKLITTAREKLDEHRGLSEFFVNLALAVVTAGVGIVIKGIINKLVLNKSFFHVHQTQSSKGVENIEDSINKAAPEA